MVSFVLQTLQRCEVRPIGVKADRELIQLGIVKSDRGPAQRKSQQKTGLRAFYKQNGRVVCIQETA